MPRKPLGIVITMAGNGQRFRDAGYVLPKFKVVVRGQTLFSWSLLSLRKFLSADVEVVFAARPEHEPDAFVAGECARLGIRSFSVMHIDTPTDGQATTALMGLEHLTSSDSPMLVYNIDTYVEPRYLSPAAVRGDGWIPCFPGLGEGWSFAKADAQGLITEVAEKRRISEHATVGLYWFSSRRTYEKLYAEHFSRNAGERGERYIAPMYNTMIAAGQGVYLTPVPAPAVHPLGTPAEVKEFSL